MSILIDVILVAVVAFSVYSGWKKGFGVTLLRCLSFIIAAVVSYYICGIIGDSVTERIIVYVISLLAVIFIIQIISPLLNKILDLPFLKFTNKTLGIVLGLLLGLVLVWLWACVLGVIVPLISGIIPDIIPENTVDKTVILRRLIEFNPLSLLNW